jgi:transcriptional regulator
MNNNKLAHRGCNDGFEMSQSQVAEELFLTQQTIAAIEKRAIEKIKAALKEKNINIKDILYEL